MDKKAAQTMLMPVKEFVMMMQKEQIKDEEDYAMRLEKLNECNRIMEDISKMEIADPDVAKGVKSMGSMVENERNYFVYHYVTNLLA